MSTALALTTDTSFDDIAKITGQDVNQGTKSFLPRLKINKDFETDDGVSIPPGTYAITLPEGETVYSKTAKFRPFINAFQYSHYDAPSKKYVNRTIIFKNWNDEAIDELGGVKCSKITGKAKTNLTKEQVEAQRAIKCYRLVYGQVSMEAATATGKKVTIDNEPCLFKVTGSAFMPVGDALQVVTSSKRPFFAAELDFEAPKREKAGATVYYIPVLKTNTKVISYNEADFALLKKFQETIDFENKPIIEKYKKAKGFIEQLDILEEIDDSQFIDMNELPHDDIGI